jgi:sulfur carrier protein
MKIVVNGKERIFNEGTTLSEMLNTLSLEITGMIIERNLEVVSRSEYDKTALKDGDKIELIRLVAGG